MRTRVTATASLAIAVAVVGGVIVLDLIQVGAVRSTLDSQLRTYATEIALASPTGAWPSVLPASTLDANAEAQVIAADGRVLAATRTLAGVPAVYALATGSTTPVRLKAADGVIPSDVRIVGNRRRVGGQDVTIITGTSTSLLVQLRSQLVSQLIIGFPVVLLAAATAVWLIVGRALRPVEQIRHAVTDITSADLSQRVPEPGTSDEIGHLAQTMNQMLARLDSSSRRQRRFVADASHELRSPLAAIRTTLEVGLAHPDSAPWPTIAERAAEQAIRLEGLIRQLLLLAKADERVASRQQQVNTSVLLNQICATTDALNRRVGLDLVRDAITLGDPDQLARLFRNLIENAVRYATSGVGVSTSVTDTQVVVVVTDDGPGIPAADRGRVFDRFVRLDSSRDRSSGNSGLGLAIVREIVAAHRGSVSITDRPGGGARFVICLPRAATGPDRPSGSSQWIDPS